MGTVVPLARYGKVASTRRVFVMFVMDDDFVRQTVFLQFVEEYIDEEPAILGDFGQQFGTNYPLRWIWGMSKV